MESEGGRGGKRENRGREIGKSNRKRLVKEREREKVRVRGTEV
jgi:hypothetical protein